MNEQLKSATSCVRWAKAQRAVPPSVNIDGLFNGGHASLCLSYGARSCLKPAARKNEFRQPFQRDLGRPDYAAKINRFSFRPNQLHLRAIPPHRRGAYASSRYVECGLRWTRWRCAREALQGGLELGLGAVSDRSAQDERRYCVRQKRVVLAPVAGVKLAEAVRIQPGSISR
jgi:hypothetical protein